MEENHHHHHQQHHQYEVVVPDFGLTPTPCYPSHPMQPAEIGYPRNPNPAAHHFDALMMAHHHQNFQQLLLEESDHQLHSQHHEIMMNRNNNNNGSSTSGGGFAADNTEANICDGGSGGVRWPRQETLTLLEIRSRLDKKFKEANQKGPLWDEISRIMSDEHGYQRSGKKCREKFENLYKYYKKTKEGKAGRQDGKHYRFFGQLEALYGENKTNTAPLLPLHEGSHFSERNCFEHMKNSTPSYTNHPNTLQLCSNANYNSGGHHNFGSLSLSCNSSEFDSASSSEDYNGLCGTGVCEIGSNEKKEMKKRRNRRNWRAKIKDFIDSQMRSLIEKQEAWLAKTMTTIEQTEKERLVREEEWKKKEVERMNRERMFWAGERQWIEARDANLMEALRKYNLGDVLGAFNSTHVMHVDHNESKHCNQWTESEITKLVEIRASMESKFEQYSGQCNNWGQEIVLWEEIANRMASLGSNKSSLMCKNKWEGINSYLVSSKKDDFYYKKQKGDVSRSLSGCYGTGDHGQVEGIPIFGGTVSDQAAHNVSSVPSSSVSAVNNNNIVPQESFFQFLMVDHEGSENLWGNNL
uniref:Myb-like domain-containing protein n=1 Tax=Kalanchoe fedtschenkoi TaxID=63787 RepID=A0A7N0UU85_KALFE